QNDKSGRAPVLQLSPFNFHPSRTMRTKVTLVLLFLNVALFFFIFRFERRWNIEKNFTEARRRVLSAETADIRSLEITGGNPVHTLALAKRGDRSEERRVGKE